MQNRIPIQSIFVSISKLVVLLLLLLLPACSSGKIGNPITPQGEDGFKYPVKVDTSAFNIPCEFSPLDEERIAASSKIGFEISDLDYDLDAGTASFSLRMTNSGPMLFNVEVDVESISPSGEMFVGDTQITILKYGILVHGVKSPRQFVKLTFQPGTKPIVKGYLKGTTTPLFRNSRTILHTDKFADHQQDFSEFSGRIIADQVLIRFKKDVSLDKQYEIFDRFHLIPVGVNLSTKFIQANILNGLHPDEVVADLKTWDEIDHAEVNAVNFIQSFPNDSAYDSSDPMWEDGANSWGFRRVQAPEAWDFYNDRTLDQSGDLDCAYTTNAKIIAFILDTGYKYHDDYAIDSEDQAFLNLGLNIVNPGSFPADDHGHGTLISGEVMAEGNNSFGIAGMAWNARIVPIKTNDYAGQGDEFRSGIGVSYAKEVALDYPDYRCVGNMSYGTHSQNQKVDRVNEESAFIDAWPVKNLQFVAAAGNCANTPSTDPSSYCYYPFSLSADNFFPSSFQWVIGVAASTYSQNNGMDNEAGFSNWGVTVDVSAPGVEICSTWKDSAQSFKRASGTSCASPMTAGLFALLWSRNPSLDKVEVAYIIKKTADPMSVPSYKKGGFGWGRINAYKALFASKYLKPPVGEKITSGDLDGDGIDETCLGINGWMQNTGKMLVFDSFGHEMTNGNLSFGANKMVTASVFADIDNDNRDEIIVANLGDPGGLFKLGNGANNLTLNLIDYSLHSFTIKPLYDFGSGKTSECMTKGDFNGDGIDEIAIAVQTNPSGYFASGTPSNNLSLHMINQNGTSIADIQIGTDMLATDLAAGDIDNDGWDEIILAYVKDPNGIYAIDSGTNEGHLMVLEDANSDFEEIPNNYSVQADRIIEQVLPVNLDDDPEKEIVISTLDLPSGYLEDQSKASSDHAGLIAFDDARAGINLIASIEYGDIRTTFELTEGNIHPNENNPFWVWFMLNPIGIDYVSGTPGGKLLMVPYRIENGQFVEAGASASSSNGYRYFSGCVRNGDFDFPVEHNETALYAIEGGRFLPKRYYEHHDDTGSNIFITWEYKFEPFINFFERWINPAGGGQNIPQP